MLPCSTHRMIDVQKERLDLRLAKFLLKWKNVTEEGSVDKSF